MAFLKTKNRAISALAAAINDSVTELSVDAGEGANFPATPDFHITIEDEIMTVTGVSTDTFTVTRGAESTTPAAHDIARPVELRITAGVIDAIEGVINDHDERHKWLGPDEQNIKDLLFGENKVYRVADLGATEGWTKTIIGNGVVSTSFGLSLVYNTSGATGEAGLITAKGLWFKHTTTYLWRVGSRIVPEDTADQEAWFGVFAANNARPTDTSNHIAFKIVDNDIYASCGNGVSGTQRLAVENFTALLNLDCFFKYMADDIKFYVNGALVETISTNRPSELLLYPGWWMWGKVADDKKALQIYGLQMLLGDD